MLMVSPVCAVRFSSAAGTTPGAVVRGAAGVVGTAGVVGVAEAEGVAVADGAAVGDAGASVDGRLGAELAAGAADLPVAGSQAVSSRVVPVVSAQTSETAARRRMRADMVTSPWKARRVVDRAVRRPSVVEPLSPGDRLLLRAMREACQPHVLELSSDCHRRATVPGGPHRERGEARRPLVGAPGLSGLSSRQLWL
ncbi:hypothetical protein GCM10020229_26260 [Kitasatospora albolonga]